MQMSPKVPSFTLNGTQKVCIISCVLLHNQTALMYVLYVGRCLHLWRNTTFCKHVGPFFMMWRCYKHEATQRQTAETPQGRCCYMFASLALIVFLAAHPAQAAGSDRSRKGVLSQSFLCFW